jgi:uncharacterized protein with ParB-like and HNH nuclease domain
MSIVAVLNQIKNEEIVLPAIQRDFVWPSEKIFKLLDSIMRGYPIGIILLWETYSDIQYRSFAKDYEPKKVYSYHDNSQRKRLKLVLDGQQRLQSLYVALYGTFEGTPLYFDVLSGRESDDVAEEKYIFAFSSHAEVEKSHSYVSEQLAKVPERRDKDFQVFHYIKVSDLFAMQAMDKERLKEKLSAELKLTDEDRVRLSINLSLLDEKLSKDESILKTLIIDENLPSESPTRKSESDVLEIFVRTNTMGTELTRSDLIFSMLKLNWKESATALPDFVRSVNEGNSFELNNDFVIRCLFAVSDLGTKFDLNLLRKKSNIEKLQRNFGRCCSAIQATVDFVQSDCWCQSSRLIGGAFTMVPFVYYLFHVRKHDIPIDQIVNARKAFYLFAFAKPFSRYADSRLWAFIRDELKPLAAKGDNSFPVRGAVWWVGYWERMNRYGEELLQRNSILALHLVQGLTGAKVHYEFNSPEVDHIFPRSELRRRGCDEARVNHFANFWILTKGKNRNKGNQHPASYFRDVDDAELQRALIDREYLDYRRYSTFLKSRSEKILSKVKAKLQFCDEDFRIDEGTGT